jgi:hypothetical protein
VLSLVVSESAWGIDQRGRRKLSGGQGSGLKGTRKRLRLASVNSKESYLEFLLEGTRISSVLLSTLAPVDLQRAAKGTNHDGHDDGVSRASK